VVDAADVVLLKPPKRPSCKSDRAELDRLVAAFVAVAHSRNDARVLVHGMRYNFYALSRPRQARLLECPSEGPFECFNDEKLGCPGWRGPSGNGDCDGP
jgi:hypothetical protein